MGARTVTVKRLIRRLVSFHFVRLLSETASAERSMYVGLVVQYYVSRYHDQMWERSWTRDVHWGGLSKFGTMWRSVVRSWVDVDDSGRRNTVKTVKTQKKKN